MDHAHPRKLHHRHSVHDDEFRIVIHHHHKSTASTRQQQASWKYDARIFRHQLQPSQPFDAAESISEGVDFVFVSQAYRNNTTNLENDHRYYICSVKSNGFMGLHVYAHSLLKNWEHTAGQVELSTHISTKQSLAAMNLKVSGMWLYIAKVTCPCRAHDFVVCCVSVQLLNLITLMWLLLNVRWSSVCSDTPHASCDTVFVVELMANNTTSRGRVLGSTKRSWAIKGQRPVEWHWRKCWVLPVSCHRCRIRRQTCGSLSSSHWAARWPQSWTPSATGCWRSGVGNSGLSWCMCWEWEAPQLHKIFTRLGTAKTTRILTTRTDCMVLRFIQFRVRKKLKCPRGRPLLKCPWRRIYHLPKRDLEKMSDLQRCFGNFKKKWEIEIPAASSSHEDCSYSYYTSTRIMLFLK